MPIPAVAQLVHLLGFQILLNFFHLTLLSVIRRRQAGTEISRLLIRPVVELVIGTEVPGQPIRRRQWRQRLVFQHRQRDQPLLGAEGLLGAFVAVAAARVRAGQLLHADHVKVKLRPPLGITAEAAGDRFGPGHAEIIEQIAMRGCGK